MRPGRADNWLGPRFGPEGFSEMLTLAFADHSQ